jgi:uncharacterized protein YjbI with pentapeptide repeats
MVRWLEKGARKMPRSATKSFNNNSSTANFTVDIRAIHDRTQVLDRLEFESKQDFCDFLKIQCIRPDGYLDLAGKDLSNLDLSGRPDGYLDLAGKDLSNLDLSGVSLMLADLNFANLTDSNLSDSDLMGAQLTNATLIGADLTNAELATSDIGGADLTRAKVTQEQLDLTFGIPMFLRNGQRPDNHPSIKNKPDNNSLNI